MLKDLIKKREEEQKAQVAIANGILIDEEEEKEESDPVEKAKNYCKGMISDLLLNRIDLSMLVISKGLGKR